MSIVDVHVAEPGQQRWRSLRTGTVKAWEVGGGAPSGAAPTAALSAVASGHDGIGWTFDQTYQCGQYCNGDWFVVGPVTITDIQPGSFNVGGRIQHGSQKNPDSGGSQGFDNEPRDASYSSALNVGFEVSTSNPLTLQPGDTLVTSRTKDTGTRPFVESIAVLTCVTEPPPAGAFRPPYVGPKTTWPVWLESSIDYTALPNLQHVAGTPDPQTIASDYRWPWYDPAVDAFKGRDFRPASNMPAYGREIMRDVNRAALTLCLDFTDAQKRDLLVNMVQVGIDNYGVTFAGGGSFVGATVAGGWFHNGGHAQGRKLPIMLAGLVLGDATLTARAADTDIWFQEDDQTFTVTQADVDRTQVGGAYGAVEQITSAMLGMPEWGIRHRAEPAKDNANPEAGYRRSDGGNGSNFGGYTLAARLLGLKTVWNHDPLFDYADRYHGLVNDPGWPDLPGVTDPTSTHAWQSSFDEAMWDAYRSTV